VNTLPDSLAGHAHQSKRTTALTVGEYQLAHDAPVEAPDPVGQHCGRKVLEMIEYVLRTGVPDT
jgi:hypothetical protein